MWTNKQKAFSVAAYLRAKSFLEKKKQYLCHYNMDGKRINETPKKMAVQRWTNNLLKSGTVVNKDRNGRPKCATTEENMIRINDSVEQSPDKSLINRCQNLNVSKTSLYRKMKKVIRQTLTPSQRDQRVHISE